MISKKKTTQTFISLATVDGFLEQLFSKCFNLSEIKISQFLDWFEMASKRAFLSVDVKNMESGNNREFEEPDVEPEKTDRKTEPDDKKDRFGPVPEVSGKEFLRNKKNEGKTTDHVRLSSHLKHTRKRDRKVAQKAELLKILNPAQTGKVKRGKIYGQNEIVKHADVQTLQKKFHLELEMGPYCIDYDASGRHLLLAGQLGHIAMIDHMTKMPKCEFSTNEVVTVRN